MDDKNIVALWTLILTNISGWNKDENILYLLNVLGMCSMTRKECESYLANYFSDMYKVRH